MSTTHLHLPRRSVPALPLLGGLFHGEKYHADVPPPALCLTTSEGAVDDFYVLHTPPGDTTHVSAAYVLESLDAETTLAWLDIWLKIACALPDAWQSHALRRLLVSRVACPGCGRCNGVYSARGAGQRDGVTFHCLDCGEQRATLAACRRDAEAGTQAIARESHRAENPGVLNTRADQERTKTT